MDFNDQQDEVVVFAIDILNIAGRINRVKRLIAFQKPVNIILPGSLMGPWFT